MGEVKIKCWIKSSTSHFGVYRNTQTQTHKHTNTHKYTGRERDVNIINGKKTRYIQEKVGDQQRCIAQRRTTWLRPTTVPVCSFVLSEEHSAVPDRWCVGTAPVVVLYVVVLYACVVVMPVCVLLYC